MSSILNPLDPNGVLVGIYFKGMLYLLLFSYEKVMLFLTYKKHFQFPFIHLQEISGVLPQCGHSVFSKLCFAFQFGNGSTSFHKVCSCYGSLVMN